MTKGSHELEKTVVLADNYDANELLRLASGVEQNSEHYIAAGLLRKVKDLNITVPDSEDFKYLPGQGLEGIVENKSIKVVGPNYLKEQNIDISETEDDFNGTLVYILIDEEVSGYFMFSD